MLPFYEIIKLESFINKHCHGESKRPNTDNPTFLLMVLLSRNDAGSSELSVFGRLLSDSKIWKFATQRFSIWQQKVHLGSWIRKCHFFVGHDRIFPFLTELNFNISDIPKICTRVCTKMGHFMKPYKLNLTFIT